MDMSFKFSLDDATEIGSPAAQGEIDIRLNPWLIAEILADLAQERARRVALASGGLRSL